MSALNLLVSVAVLAMWMGPLCFGETSLAQLVETDYVLPAYLNSDTATLAIQPTKLLQAPLSIELSFAERTTGAVPAKPIYVNVPAGPGRTDVRINIASWPDGEYVTKIRERREDGQDTGRLVRVLRKQAIPAPAPPAEPIAVARLTTLFVDDWYLKESRSLRFAVHPAEQFPITQGMLGENRPMQRGLGLELLPDGTLRVRFKDMNRREQDPQFYVARSRDGVRWTIERDEKKSVSVTPNAEKESPPPTYRFYDPQKDGPVPLKEIQVKHCGYVPTKWGNIDIPARSIYPLWKKSANEFVILSKEPLLQDRYEYKEGDTGDWKGSNDNFAGQWFSKNGKTLHYCQGRTLPRFAPFRISYDNIPACYRILVVWSTQDGLRWTPSYFSLPTEADPVGYQHYGARIFEAEGKNLWLAYLYAYNAAAQQIYLELNYSRDGILWKRFPGEPAFAANGPFGSWNFGWIFPGSCVEKDGMTYDLLPYCCNRVHFYGEFGDNRADLSAITANWLQKTFERKGLTRWPYWRELGSWQALAEDARKASQTLGILRYRTDGRVSIRPTAAQGVLVTKALSAGKTLAVNAKTETGGSIRVEVLDADDREIPGYCGKKAATFSGDSTRFALGWSDRALKELPSVPLRLRITITNGELFALYW